MTAEAKKENRLSLGAVVEAIGQAASAVKGLKKPKSGQRLETEQQTERPFDSLRGRAKDKTPPIKRVQPKAKPETEEWAKEVVAGLRKGELPPELTVVDSVEASQQVIAKVQSTNQAKWLLEGAEVPQSELVARVVADIASSTLIDNPDYLLAKGAQLRWAINPYETPPEVQAEARVLLRKIHDKVLEQYRERYNWPNATLKLDEQEELILKTGSQSPVSHDQRAVYETVGHNLSGFESGMMPAGGAPTPPRIWAGTTTGNADLDRLLQGLQNQFDNAPRYVGDMKFVDQAIKEISKYNSADIARAGTSPLSELDRLFGDLQREAILQYRGADINQPWSSFYMSPERRKQLILYPEWAFAEVYRQINLTVDFFAEGSLTEAIEMDVRRMGQYYADAQYVEDVRGIMIDPTDRPEIEAAYGTPVDPDNLASHPFYRDRVKRLKEINDKINSQEHLLRTYGVAKYGIEMQKVAQSAANLGDSGVWRIKMNNGGLTGLAYDLFDTIGQDMGISEKYGRAMRVTGREVELLKANVRQVFIDNQNALNEIYQSYWQQQGEPHIVNMEQGMQVIPRAVELTPDAIDGIVREAEMLYTVTLRDVAMTDRGLSPWEGRGQNGQSVQYAGTRGIELALRGRSPIRWLVNRWDLLPSTGQLHLRNMAHDYAVAAGVEKRIDHWLDETMRDPQYKRELAEYALNIVEQNPTNRANFEDEMLRFHFSVDLRGYDTKHPPIDTQTQKFSIDKLTRRQLKELLMYKEGVKYADTILGSYDYEGASWVVSEKIKQYVRVWGPDRSKVIGLSDKKRQDGGKLLSAENEKDLKKAQSKLVYGENGEPGVLRVMAKYMPHRHFQDLVEHHDYETRSQFEQWVDEGLFVNLFTEKLVDGSSRPVVIERNRPDKVYKRLKLVHTMTDEFLGHDGEGPIDYSDPDSMVATQSNRLRQVCQNLGVDYDNYVNAMKTMSGHVGQEQQISQLVQPEYFDTYRLTQDLDAREKYLDKPRQAPGSVYSEGATLLSSQIEIRVSSEIGGEKGKGLQSGLGRTINDDAGATDNALSLATKIIGARSVKKLLEALPEFAVKILFTAGATTKDRGVAITSGSWAKCAQMDRQKDWFIYGSMIEDRFPTSPFQRVGVTGEHGDPSITKNEIHHFWNDVQTSANLTFHPEIPWLNSEIERALGLIWKIPFFGKHIETSMPLYVYQSYLAILVALGLVGAKSADIAQEELGGGEKHSR